MAQVIAGGSLVTVIGGGAVFYFQPHSVISVLARQFTRIVWCLSPKAAPVRHPRSRSASATPSRWERVKSRVAEGRRQISDQAQRVYSLVMGAVGITPTAQVEALSSADGVTSTDDSDFGAIEALSELEEGRAVNAPNGVEEEWLPGVEENLVALTIDDSPSVHTAEALDILKENDCHATFFVIGNHVESMDNGEGDRLLARMVAEGHELGNHTWFDRPSIRLPFNILEEEVLRMDALIDRHYAEAEQTPDVERMKWFRPGSGYFSDEMCGIVERYGYRTVLGCRFPLDTASPDPSINAWHVIRGIHPGAIIVLHDARERIKPTLRILLPKLKERGYRLVTMSELFHAAASGTIAKGSSCDTDDVHHLDHHQVASSSFGTASRRLSRSFSAPSGFTFISSTDEDEIELAAMQTAANNAAVLAVEGDS